jgi:hypothetical protein
MGHARGTRDALEHGDALNRRPIGHRLHWLMDKLTLLRMRATVRLLQLECTVLRLALGADRRSNSTTGSLHLRR